MPGLFGTQGEFDIESGATVVNPIQNNGLPNALNTIAGGIETAGELFAAGKAKEVASSKETPSGNRKTPRSTFIAGSRTNSAKPPGSKLVVRSVSQTVSCPVRQ